MNRRMLSPPRSATGQPLRRSPVVHARRLGDEAVLYDEARHEALYLNSFAAALWERLDSAGTIDHLVADLAREFALLPRTIASWTDQALGHLKREGWVWEFGNPDSMKRAAPLGGDHEFMTDEARFPAPERGKPPDSAQPLNAPSQAGFSPAHYQIGAVALTLSGSHAPTIRTFDALYRVYRVAVSSPIALEVIIERSHPSWPFVPPLFDVWVDGHRRFSRIRPEALLPHLEWAINGGVIHAFPHRVQVHAGVASRDGVGIMFPAPPQSGKSTLVTLLVKRGWSYLSDEFALLDCDRMVSHAYPKAICIKDGSVEALERIGVPVGGLPRHLKGKKGGVRFLDPGALNASAVIAQTKIRAIIFPRYTRAAVPRYTPLSPARALFDLLPLTLNFTRFRRSGVERLASLVEATRQARLEFGDLEAVGDFLDRWADEPPSAAGYPADGESSLCPACRGHQGAGISVEGAAEELCALGG